MKISKALMVLIIAALFSVPSFAGVVRFSAKKAAPVAKFVSFPERHPKKFVKGFAKALF